MRIKDEMCHIVEKLKTIYPGMHINVGYNVQNFNHINELQIAFSVYVEDNINHSFFKTIGDIKRFLDIKDQEKKESILMAKH